MNSNFDFPATARSLVDYFARQEASGGDRWTAGRVAAQEWLRLIQINDPSVEDLLRLDQFMLAGSGDSGSGWQELRMAYEQWRASR